jgi:hypothetical protein
MYVLGGTINNQGTRNVTESLPTAELLNTLFGAPAESDPPATAPLDIPQDLAYQVIQNRQEPRRWNDPTLVQCYKPPCSDASIVPDLSGCIKP